MRGGQPGRERAMPWFPEVAPPSSFPFTRQPPVACSQQRSTGEIFFPSALHFGLPSIEPSPYTSGVIEQLKGEEEFFCFCCGEIEREVDRMERTSQQL